jgi:hypothetical protein
MQRTGRSLGVTGRIVRHPGRDPGRCAQPPQCAGVRPVSGNQSNRASHKASDEGRPGRVSCDHGVHHVWQPDHVHHSWTRANPANPVPRPGDASRGRSGLDGRWRTHDRARQFRGDTGPRDTGPRDTGPMVHHVGGRHDRVRPLRDMLGGRGGDGFGLGGGRSRAGLSLGRRGRQRPSRSRCATTARAQSRTSRASIASVSAPSLMVCSAVTTMVVIKLASGAKSGPVSSR